jgi:hypothetical protein
MKNSCYTCNYYGKCAVQVKSCPDWKEWDKETIVLSLDQFNGMWLGLHKKWYEKYDPKLLKDRQDTIALYLAGKTEKQIVDELSATIGEEVLKELDKYERKEE